MAIKTDLDEALKKIERLEAAAKRDKDDIRRCTERIDDLANRERTAVAEVGKLTKKLERTEIVLQQTVTALASAIGVPGALASNPYNMTLFRG